MEHEDYNTKLREEWLELSQKVRNGALDERERVSEAKRIVEEYVSAQDAHFEDVRDRGKTPPIQYRNSALLDRLANIVLHDDITWSHQDKMSIIEYPIMSDRQYDRRLIREKSHGNLVVGKDNVTMGRKRTPTGGFERVYDYSSPTHDNGPIPVEHVELHEALKNVKLSHRQRQVVELIMHEGLNQDELSERLSVSRRAVREYTEVAFGKLRKYLTNKPAENRV